MNKEIDVLWLFLTITIILMSIGSCQNASKMNALDKRVVQLESKR